MPGGSFTQTAARACDDDYFAFDVLAHEAIIYSYNLSEMSEHHVRRCVGARERRGR